MNNNLITSGGVENDAKGKGRPKVYMSREM